MKAPAGCSVSFQQTGRAGLISASSAQWSRQEKRNDIPSFVQHWKAARTNNNCWGNLASYTCLKNSCILSPPTPLGRFDVPPSKFSRLVPSLILLFPSTFSKRSTWAHQISLRCSFPSLQTHQVSTSRLKENTKEGWAKCQWWLPPRKKGCKKLAFSSLNVFIFAKSTASSL